ncbi:MAG TPA: FecR domain-containing protein, partial [Myxococcota bacterium]|nr:FecR domain-containing protein [Myxococcota bacterium]
RALAPLRYDRPAPALPASRARRAPRWLAPLALAAVFALAVVGLWLALRPPPRAPGLGTSDLASSGTPAPGTGPGPGPGPGPATGMAPSPGPSTAVAFTSVATPAPTPGPGPGPGPAPAVVVAWNVTALAGAPSCDGAPVTSAGRLPVGTWLETDATARAVLAVADIGTLEVDPNTRLRLAESGDARHRLELKHGTIHASVVAPPRIFLVDAPSAQAVDLGCAYSLQVDDAGNGELRVTSGRVELERDGRVSYVLRGAVCPLRPSGPGTPYMDDAATALRAALARFDFEGGGAAALDAVLAAARPSAPGTAGDALTLWNLVRRVVDPATRAVVYARLKALRAPPPGVSDEDVLALEPSAVRRWEAGLESDTGTWSKDSSKKVPPGKRE